MKLLFHVFVSPTVSFAFEHAGPRLTIGRDPSCELPLAHPEARGVSRKHATIGLTSKGAFVRDLSSSNGTFVNDRRADQPLQFQVGDTIRLGPQGPAFRVVVLELGQAAQPVLVASQPAAPQAQRPAALVPVQAQAQPAQAAPRPAAPAPVQKIPAQVIKVTPAAAPAVPQPPVESATRRLVVKLQKRQRKTMFGMMAAGLACLVMGGCLFIQGGQLSNLWAEWTGAKSREVELTKTTSDQAQKLKELKDKMTEMTEAEASSLFQRYGDAVYLVRCERHFIDPATNREMIATMHGTAFAVDSSGVFATNAHVAGPAKKEYILKGGKVELISQGGKRVYKVIDAKQHPRYTGIKSPDVGLLKIELPAGQKVPTVVPLATESDLRELTSGSPLCYIGFPMYTRTDYDSKLTKAVARTYQGRLNRLLTFTEEQGDFATQQFLEHDMLSYKGASGSPIFNKRGRVVALLNSGAVFPANEAVAPSDPAKGAIRVDLLQELMKTPW
jgi:pSer/pThr/pTyr-binding forkhead associated (FHA) protein